MARTPNHAYEKRQRELAKKKKKADKLERKRAAREQRAADRGDAPQGEE